MSTSGQLNNILKRTIESTGSYTNRGLPPSKLDAVTIATAKAAHINTELLSFIAFCYKRNEEGKFVNLSSGTQIASGTRCPWGSSCKGMVLTKPDRWICRHWLLSFAGERPKPLFFYVPDSRRWFVNTVSWDSLALALQWAQAHAMTAEKYIELHQAWLAR